MKSPEILNSFRTSSNFRRKVFRLSNDFGSGGDISSLNPSKCRPFCPEIPLIALSFSIKYPLISLSFSTKRPSISLSFSKKKEGGLRICYIINNFAMEKIKVERNRLWRRTIWRGVLMWRCWSGKRVRSGNLCW